MHIKQYLNLKFYTVVKKGGAHLALKGGIIAYITRKSFFLNYCGSSEKQEERTNSDRNSMRNYAPHTEVSNSLQDWHPREAKRGKNGTFIDGAYTGSQTGSLVSELGPSPGQCPGVEMIRSPFPRMPPQSSREQRMPYPADAGKLAPMCLAHSPASISQLRAFSSIDKVRLLLARVPWEGSRRFPLNNVP